MSLHLQPVQVATGSNDTESHLVFADGFLVAILVQLSEQHEDEAGSWFLEAGFGRVHHQNAPQVREPRTWRRTGSSGNLPAR